jgi:hypothetical protein
MIHQLPKVDISGTEFFIDLRLEEFRQVSNPFNTISFVELMENEEGYVLCYDPVKRTAFRGDMEEFEERKAELKLLQLPKLQDMDPVGFEQWVDRIQEQMIHTISRRR